MKVGINGFGRIGKTIYKILRDRNIDVPQINDPFVDVEYIKYLLKYDSTTGQSSASISAENNTITYNGHVSTLSSIKNPEDIVWNVDVVIESSGVFTTQSQVERHKAPFIIITAPSIDVPMFVYGVNHKNYKNEKIISNASCTTNCLAPLAKIINDNFSIKEGLMTTVHAVTASQKVVDSVGKKKRLCRSAIQNIIPASTGAAKAVGKIIPSLSGKITGMAFRVPVANVSVVDFTFKTEKKTSLDEIVKKIEADISMKNIVGIVRDEVVSSDFNKCSLSSILDVNASIALSDTFFKVISWYDNEYGYSCRVVDLLEYVIKNKH